MDSFELNKIVGAILVTALTVTVIGHVGDILVPIEEADHGEAAQMASADGGAGDAPTQSEQEEPLPVRLASASAEDGEGVARRCASCHTFEEGGANKVGPNLHGVVGRDRGAVEGFNYSGGMANIGGTWDYESLDSFLDNPGSMVQGTKMSFRLRDPDDRADMIVYLQSISPDAPPLPEPEEQQAAAEDDGDEAEGGEQAATEGDEQPATEGEGEAATDGDAPPQGGQETADGDEEATEGDEDGELAAIFAEADAEAGEGVARRCASCHTFEDGAPNRVGPNLFGVVGRERGSVEGFNYSNGLREMGGEWDYAGLLEYLENPRDYVDGSRMTFRLTDEQDRADIIAYLKSISPDAPPLPGQDE